MSNRSRGIGTQKSKMMSLQDSGNYVWKGLRICELEKGLGVSGSTEEDFMLRKEHIQFSYLFTLLHLRNKLTF